MNPKSFIESEIEKQLLSKGFAVLEASKGGAIAGAKWEELSHSPKGLIFDFLLSYAENEIGEKK